MTATALVKFTKRYHLVTEEKSGGVTYTPKCLADFVAEQIVTLARALPEGRPIRMLDPAIGHGELLLSLLQRLESAGSVQVEVYGFDTDENSIAIANARIRERFPSAAVHFAFGNFLEFVLANFDQGETGSLFSPAAPESYDLIIANPPYVRTQIMGASQAQLLAGQFGLTGRVDLYYAFILAMSQVLNPQGIAGIIVSNRFMTTRSGAAVRREILRQFNLRQVWDMGDTKLFDAAVLPAVLLVEGSNGHKAETPSFTSIYETNQPAEHKVPDAISALAAQGIVAVEDGRRFHVQHGKLDNGAAAEGVWRISTQVVDSWLAAVGERTWGTFRDIGKIRVGVKTCADKIFIRSDWQDRPVSERPELLRPVTTHHVARRFRPLTADRPAQILYPHESVDGRRRPVDLSDYPRSREYLENHRAQLEGRKYVIEAGRAWYEVWVPQDPAVWDAPKLVFRDIAEEPTFWIDLDRSVVNGDCYWLVCQNGRSEDFLWLAAAVGNSTFIERFYDARFHNKLYAGRRRFITQYVEQFPLPDPQSSLGKAIIEKSRQAWERVPSGKADQLQEELNAMVWEALCGTAPS